jgi:hypothetical protein
MYIVLNDTRATNKSGEIHQYIRFTLFNECGSGRYLLSTKSFNKKYSTLSQVEKYITETKTHYNFVKCNNHSIYQKEYIDELMKKLNVELIYNENNKRQRIKKFNLKEFNSKRL